MSLMVRHPRTHSRQQRLLRAGLVVLGILTLIVLPGYLASLPGFFGRYSELSEKYEPWASSTHAEAGCDACHVAPDALPRAVYRARLVGEFYLSLVARKSRTPGYFESPTNDSCLECHSDLRSVSPKGDLQIPHRAHIGILKMRCVECHDYLVHELSPEGKHVPPMTECLGCHDGRTAESACTACHTSKAAPENHSAGDWQYTHAEAAKSDGCENCHRWREDWCVDCHTDRPVSHTADWRATHGDRVAEHRSCEACHENAFCVRCHGVLPSLNYDPGLRLVE